MKRLLSIMFGVAVLALGFTACDGAKNNVTPPEKVSQALETRYPGNSAAKWEMKDSIYVAEFDNSQGHEVEVWINADGTWAMTETEYDKDLTQLPYAVTTAYQATQYALDWKVDEVTFYQRPDAEFYVIEIEKSGQKDRELYYQSDGNLIKDVEESHAKITPTTPI